jgi:hypothetical protein
VRPSPISPTGTGIFQATNSSQLPFAHNPSRTAAPRRGSVACLAQGNAAARVDFPWTGHHPGAQPRNRDFEQVRLSALVRGVSAISGATGCHLVLRVRQASPPESGGEPA